METLINIDSNSASIAIGLISHLSGYIDSSTVSPIKNIRSEIEEEIREKKFLPIEPSNRKLFETESMYIWCVSNSLKMLIGIFP